MNRIDTECRRLRPVVLCLISLLLLCGIFVVSAAADEPLSPRTGERYALTVQFELLDDNGEVGRLGIKTELAPGTPIDLEALIAADPAMAAILTEFKLRDNGIVGMPADGLMPAAALTVTARYATEPFTVTWIVDGATVTDTVAYGDVPVYPGTTPAKASDAEFHYTFAGWDHPMTEIYADTTYTAVFDKTLRSYTVTFHYGDGKTHTETVRYGYAVDAPTDTEKTDTAEWDYTFTGWDHDLEAITGDTTVTAHYSQVKQLYPVTFHYGDGQTVTVRTPYGEAADAPTDLDKAPTVEWSYTFDKWNVSIDRITGPLTVHAEYIQTKRTYTVTFVYGDGKTATETVEYGSGATAPTDTERTDTAEWDYTFDRWDTAYDRITGDLTVTALYNETKRSYTVTFYYGDDKIKTETVEYGSAATPPTDTAQSDTAEWDYTFDRWDTAYDRITGDTIVKAVYKQDKQTYKVTFLFGDGKSETVTVKYGEAAKAPTDTAKSPDDEFGYVFTGWDRAFDAVTETITVNALYDSIPVEAYTEPVTDPVTEPVTEPGSDTEPGTTPNPDTGDTTDTTQDPGTDTEPETNPTPDTSGGNTDTDPGEGSTADPGTDSDTGTDPAPIGGCNGSWWWILIVLVVIAIAAGLFLFLRQKGSKQTDENAPPYRVVASITADAVDALMTDKLAEDLLEHSPESAGSGKLGIVNLGVINTAYQADETVTLENLKTKGLVDVSIERIKILASGTLDKPLTVKAGAFSVQAIKMILLTGGHPVKLDGE